MPNQVVSRDQIYTFILSNLIVNDLFVLINRSGQECNQSFNLLQKKPSGLKGFFVNVGVTEGNGFISFFESIELKQDLTIQSGDQYG